MSLTLAILSASFTSLARVLTCAALSTCACFAVELVERLVVGAFGHDVRDLVTEHDLDLVVRGLRVLDGVVQQRRGQHDGILDVRLHQDVGDLNRMIDVRRRFRVLAFQKPCFSARRPRLCSTSSMWVAMDATIPSRGC
jgi:hypothetical protein